MEDISFESFDRVYWSPTVILSLWLKSSPLSDLVTGHAPADQPVAVVDKSKPFCLSQIIFGHLSDL